MYTFDHGLFLALNFDGGKTLDTIMETISGTAMWIPLYVFIIATVASMAVLSACAIRNRWYTAFIVFATLLICYSRIYLACHFPMDIALGLVVGLIAGGAMYLLWKKLDEVVKK